MNEFTTQSEQTYLSTVELSYKLVFAIQESALLTINNKGIIPHDALIAYSRH